MKNIFYFLSLACIILFGGCSSDNDEYTEAGISDSNVACTKLRVGVGLPGADATRADFQNTITNIVWSIGDRILAVGYDDEGFATGMQELTIDESSIGKAEADFVGNPVENAVSYRFVYHGKDVHYDIPEEQYGIGLVKCRYFQQVQNETDANGFDHIKDMLFMCTNIVPTSSTGKIQGGILNIQNSILQIDIQNLPKSFDKDGNYTVKYFVNFVEGVIPSAVLTYKGKISARNYLYMAFDPENDIEQGRKIAFQLSDGTNTLNTSHVSGGKKYEGGMIYTVKIDEGWTWIDEKNPSTVEWIDLGLSVKWASHNIGANTPEEYGDYFAWGETTPKSEYTRENNKTYGNNMIDISGNAEYDAATKNWGANTRTPTIEECKELRDNCTWKWSSNNEVKGYFVTGPNGNNIFLPAAGYRSGTMLYSSKKEGFYWSSTPINGLYGYAFYLFFNSKEKNELGIFRYFGYTIRPVSD